MNHCSRDDQKRTARRRFAYILLASALMLMLWSVLGVMPQATDRFGGRLLIVAPHPDDEGIAAAGLIEQAHARYAQVKVVIIMSGDSGARVASMLLGRSDIRPSDYRAVGRARVDESREALGKLGVHPADIIFLGYPDGSLNSLWERDWDSDHLHLGLNGAYRSPYPFAFQPRVPYCGENVARNLATIIGVYQPTSIVYPDGADDHHDHWAASAFVQYAAALDGWNGKEYTYLVHKKGFPGVDARGPGGPLEPPVDLLTSRTNWDVVPLNRTQLRAKSAVVGTYKVPGIVKRSFLESFVRKNELLAIPWQQKVHRTAAGPDYAAPDMPFVLDADPLDDAVRPSAGSSGELGPVSAVISGKTLWVGVQTAGAPSDRLSYWFRMRALGGGDPVRADVEIRGGRARFRRLASNSFVPCGTGLVHMLGRRIWLEMPASFARGRSTLMLGIDSCAGGRRLDGTAWRRYAI